MNDNKELNKLFANYNLSLDLQANDFAGPCLAVVYPDNQVEFGTPLFVDIMLKKDTDCIRAPMLQQAVDWFRVKHGIVIDVFQEFNGTDAYTGYWELDISKLRKYESPHEIVVNQLFDDPYKGWIKGLEVALQYVARKK